MDDLLSIRGLSIDFGGFRALDDIDLDVGSGKLVGLIGPNGCGKSTMMRCISRIYEPTSGIVTVDGMDMSRLRPVEIAKLVASVPAEMGATFNMTVMDMVVLGRYPFVDRLWWETPEDERITREALRTFGLDHIRNRPLSLCSSGERQRALIAKAYVQEPKLMLVDEPTAHLDMKYKLQVMEYLRSMARKDMSVLVAEHDISLMARYCDVCVIMKQGRIVTIGDPKVVITEELIREVYEVDSRVGLDADGEIYVLPKNYIEEERCTEHTCHSALEERSSSGGVRYEARRCRGYGPRPQVRGRPRVLRAAHPVRRREHEPLQTGRRHGDRGGFREEHPEDPPRMGHGRRRQDRRIAEREGYRLPAGHRHEDGGRPQDEMRPRELPSGGRGVRRRRQDHRRDAAARQGDNRRGHRSIGVPDEGRHPGHALALERGLPRAGLLQGGLPDRDNRRRCARGQRRFGEGDGGRIGDSHRAGPPAMPCARPSSS